MHWFLGSYPPHRMLDANGQAMRALAGLFHPWPLPIGERHLQISQDRDRTSIQGFTLALQPGVEAV